MGNRAELKKRMPALLLHEGTWEGVYRFVNLDGKVIDQYKSRITCQFPDSGPWVYVQQNHYEWPDGRVFDTDFGGELRGNRIWWDTDRFSGYGWVTFDDIVMLTLDRKDNPGESFTEMIVLAPDQNYRARTWQWFRNGKPFQRTLCDEHRVASV